MKYFNAGESLEFILAENKEITYHIHNHVSKYVVGLVLDGNVELVQNAQTTLCVQDDLFIIPVFAAHALRLMDLSSRLLVLCIADSFLEQNDESICSHKLQCLTASLRESCLINETQETAFFDALDVICRMNKEKEKLPEPIEIVTRKVVEMPEENWNLDELADSIYINKYYLIRKFKKTIGLTPHYFQIQNRIRKAQRLLLTDRSISDTAVEMGFFDQSHFDKAFRAVMGISPQEYVTSIESLHQKTQEKE